MALTGLKCQQVCVPTEDSRGISISLRFVATASPPYSLFVYPFLDLQSQQCWPQFSYCHHFGLLFKDHNIPDKFPVLKAGD